MYLPWSEKEVSDYLDNRNPNLISLYLDKSLDINSPPEIANFLGGRLSPMLLMIDEELIINTSKKEGRGKALLLMEELFEPSKFIDN
ncbi:MAG: hypothetical protein ABH804_02675 [archaeon]